MEPKKTSSLESKEEDKPPSKEKKFPFENNGNLLGTNNHQPHKWRDWHERETPVKIEGLATRTGIKIRIFSETFSNTLDFCYPNSIWQKYPEENKVKLIDNITYVFTAHLPFLLKGNIRLEYNTGYPHSYSWGTQCFMRHLPAYWYLFRGKRGTRFFPILKTLLNSNVYFSETKDFPPRFPETIDENIIIPFTFGKDSLLTYNLAKEIGLKPTLVYFNEPTEKYAGFHKLELIKRFAKATKDKVRYVENPFGLLREPGDGWFGWELAITSYALLSLPFAFDKKAGYIVFSNEESASAFFYDESGLKVAPDYDQSAQATEELSILTQSLSEGEVYTTTFSQGLNDLGILAILKDRYYDNSFKYLMSCWAETEAAKDKRWCGQCPKCARLYVYLTANGIDPQKEAGFKENMLALEKEHLYYVLSGKSSRVGWDAFGLGKEEQALAFYLTYLRGNRDPLVEKFASSPLFLEVERRFDELVNEYYCLHEEHITPPQWKKKISQIYKESLERAREEIADLKNFKKWSFYDVDRKPIGPVALPA